MELQRQKKQETGLTLSSGMIFSIVLALTWMRRTVVGYVLTYVQRVPYIGVPIAKIYPVLLVALSLLALPWLCKRIRVSDHPQTKLLPLCETFSYEKFAAGRLEFIEDVLKDQFHFNKVIKALGGVA